MERARFHRTVAIITGAASGIGLSVIRDLVREGGTVVAVDYRPGQAARALVDCEADVSNSLALEGDVTQPTDVASIVETTLRAFGRIDLLVNSAGIVEGDDILSIDSALWDRNVASVLGSVFLCSKACLSPMLMQRRGAIVNIASVNGMAAFGDDAYSAAKAGVISLTKSIAVRYGRFGIRCNAVAPADVRTPRWDSRLREDPLVLERLAKWYPLGRIGEPEDVARAVLFLASDDASWITGAVLLVDGGLLAGHQAVMLEAYPMGRSSS